MICNKQLMIRLIGGRKEMRVYIYSMVFITLERIIYMKEQKDNKTIDYCVNLLNETLERYKALLKEISKMDHKINQLEGIINTALEYGKL